MAHTSKQWTDQQILEEFREIALLDSVSNVLSWDFEVMLPEGAQPFRQEQSSTVAKLRFEKFTAPAFSQAVLESNSKDPHIHRLKKKMAEALALDSKFVAEKVALTMSCQSAWKKARAEDNFSLVEPKLKRLIEMTNEGVSRLRESKILKDQLATKSNYEILLDEYDPGFCAKALKELLGNLARETKKRIPKILELQSKKATERSRVKELLRMEIPKQQVAVNRVMQDLGFNFKKGRIDVSTHPFCGGSPDDIRLTTRYREEDFSDALYGCIHETGHALYSGGLPAELRFTPCGDTDSFGIHESQSRLYENNLGRSMPFFKYLSKVIDRTPEDLHLMLNWVEPSFIRVDADEVTYNLHVALRMEIEESLIDGSLQTKDLPEVWRQKFKDLFDLEIQKDSQGCLQDIHWYFGAFGYFPSYSIGNILAAQIFENFSEEHSSWRSEAECGDFSNLLVYLRDKVHSLASIEDTPGRIHKILNGQNLGIESFLRHVDSKYLG